MSSQSLLLETYLRCRSELIGFAVRRSRSRSRQEAQDLVHEAVFRLLNQPCEHIDNLRAYLFKTIRNIATDCARKNIVEASGAETALHVDEDLRSPERILMGEEAWAAAVQAIERLPRKTRTALVMLRLEGRGYEEIAAVFGIRVHSARRLVERATESLKQSMAHREES